MKKKLQSIPHFRNEDEERDFWSTHSSADYLDWSKAKPVAFPNLKPSNQTISLRLPDSLLQRIKLQANKLDVPYQSLMKVKLYEIFEKPMTIYDPNKKKKS